jgi:hypothetical protein
MQKLDAFSLSPCKFVLIPTFQHGQVGRTCRCIPIYAAPQQPLPIEAPGTIFNITCIGFVDEASTFLPLVVDIQHKESNPHIYNYQSLVSYTVSKSCFLPVTLFNPSILSIGRTVYCLSFSVLTAARHESLTSRDFAPAGPKRASSP